MSISRVSVSLARAPRSSVSLSALSLKSRSCTSREPAAQAVQLCCACAHLHVSIRSLLSPQSLQLSQVLLQARVFVCQPQPAMRFALRDLLSEHCRASPNVRRGAAHALCADFVSAPPPPPPTSLHAYACDCVALHLNLAPEKGSKCMRKKNDGSFCWTQCCRPDLDNPHKPPAASRA